jgi:hypothetical protein
MRLRNLLRIPTWAAIPSLPGYGIYKIATSSSGDTKEDNSKA